MLYPLDNPKPQGFARFGSRIGRAGDVGPGPNGDGVPDIIVGASSNDNPAGCGNDPTTGRTLTLAAQIPQGCRVNEGEAFIFSGTNGALIRTLNVPASDQAPAPCASSCGNLGLAVQGFGDATGDGVVDQLVNMATFNFDTATNGPCANPAAPTCNRGQGAEYVFDGATGARVRRTDDPAPQAGVFWGFQDAEPLAPGDVNGDGRADYYANGFQQNGPAGASQNTWGRAWVFSGANGAVLYEVKDPTPADGGQFGWSLTKTDYNKDGKPDLYVGQSPHHVPNSPGTQVDQSGGTYVYDGQDGSLLKSLELPPSDAQPGAAGNNGSNLGWGMAAPGDLNGDGEPDYVAGAPFTDVGPAGLNCQAPTQGCVQDVGREFFFYSNNFPVGVPTGVPVPGTVVSGTTTTTGPPPAGGDEGAPLADADARNPQKLPKITVLAKANKPVKFATPGSDIVLTKAAGLRAAKAKRFRLPTVQADAPARTEVKLTLRVPRKAVSAIKARLKRGGGATARVRVVATDSAGNQSTVSRTIRIKR